MGRLRIAAFGAGGLVAVLALSLGSSFAWAVSSARGVLSSTYDVHRVDFPIPFPLDAGERAALDPTADADAVATERAVARGRHLVEARYACAACHGQDFGGGVMIDDPMLGSLLGPNLTRGAGSRTLDYTSADWDRMVRHGVKPDGTASPMPSKDFFAMSDRELSDIVSYIRSLPAVDHEVPPVAFGPVGTVLVATGAFQISADVHPTHHVGAHEAEPPSASVDAGFGRHLALACTGCHRADFTGGPIPGGAPDWPPAGNLTALASWSYEDFVGALRTAERPDGTPLRPPMSDIVPMAANMTDVELKAMWSFLHGLPAAPTGL